MAALSPAKRSIRANGPRRRVVERPTAPSITSTSSTLPPPRSPITPRAAGSLARHPPPVRVQPAAPGQTAAKAAQHLFVEQGDGAPLCAAEDDQANRVGAD